MKYLYSLCIVLLLVGCGSTELGEEINVISHNPNQREVPACNFDQSATFENYPINPTSWYSPNYQDIFGFQRCTFEPLGYREKFVAQYYGSDKFDDIYNQHVFDLSTSEDDMQLFFRNDGVFSYPAFEGKLYMERTWSETMHITWCDAKFLDGDGNTISSSGSFYVRF